MVWFVGGIGFFLLICGELLYWFVVLMVNVMVVGKGIGKNSMCKVLVDKMNVIFVVGLVFVKLGKKVLVVLKKGESILCGKMCLLE